MLDSDQQQRLMHLAHGNTSGDAARPTGNTSDPQAMRQNIEDTHTTRIAIQFLPASVLL